MRSAANNPSPARIAGRERRCTAKGPRGALLTLLGTTFACVSLADPPLVTNEQRPGVGEHKRPIGEPMSFEGELPGRAGMQFWHIDLMPDGRFQERIVAREGGPPFDEIGRWREEGTRRLVLSGSRRGPPLYFALSDDATSLNRLSAPSGSEAGGSLQRLPQARLLEPRLWLAGTLRHGDGATFMELCADGDSVLLLEHADYPALRSAYLKVLVEHDGHALADVEGSIVLRLAPNGIARRSLIVERFHTFRPEATCVNPLAEAPLRGTYWRLVTLGSEPADPSRATYITFANGRMRVTVDNDSATDDDDCERATGAFRLSGEELRFSRMAASGGDCGRNLPQQEYLLKALADTRRHRIVGHYLELVGDDRFTIIARFEADLARPKRR